jgi:NAD(P)-dependent dehydrogenase (short-subunit alcohol dehydrogenase family)
VFEPALLRNKKVLITGGGTGLGKSMGRRMAELGADLVICGRRLEVLRATAAEFKAELGAEVSTVRCDVRDPAAVEAMLDEIWRDRPLDALVNNAAGNFIAQTHKLSPRAVDAVLNIVLHGSAYCTIGCGRRWIEAKRGGNVVSIVAAYAWGGAPFVVPSAMAKAGVLAMTRSLALEWGSKGIRCNAIAPGLFPTKGAWERLFPGERGDAEALKAVPLGRFGEHIELANLACYMISDQAGYLNGETITLDGGKQWSGGQSKLHGWTDADWEKIRPKPTGH